MIYPTVLRVQPLYEKSGPNKISIGQAADHNARTGGDIVHIDPARTPLNRVLLGSGDILDDMAPYLKQYPRASKNGPIAGEVLLTANKEFFDSLSEAERNKWANDSLAWTLAEFVAQNKGKVVSCIWHRDEEAEHLHIIVVPIVECSSGNQYRKKSTMKINYSGVLGKPRGGEKGIAPSERLWGKKQTAYSEYMAEKGHQLVRGVKNRRLRTHKSPAQFRKELSDYMSKIIKTIGNAPDSGLISKKEAVQFITAKVSLMLKDSTQRMQELENRVEALQQVIDDAAKMLGCSSPTNLPNHAKYMTYGLGCIEYTPQEIAAEGHKTWQAVEKKQASAQEIKAVEDHPAPDAPPMQPRRKKGQRKTPEERRAARLARKQKAEQERHLNRITHQIIHLDKEITYDARTNRQLNTTRAYDNVQKASSVPIQSSEQRNVSALHTLGAPTA